MICEELTIEELQLFWMIRLEVWTTFSGLKVANSCPQLRVDQASSGAISQEMAGE
jgi:hypothetical protein